MTSERHLWIAHLSIRATKTNPKFKLTVQLQLLQNGHFIETNLINWMTVLWQNGKPVLNWCRLVAIAWWVDSWQLRDVYKRETAIATALDHTTHFRIALLVHGLNPTSDANVAGGRAAGERCYECDRGKSATTTGRSAGTYQLSRAVKSTVLTVSTLTIRLWYWWLLVVRSYGRDRSISTETGAAVPGTPKLLSLFHDVLLLSESPNNHPE